MAKLIIRIILATIVSIVIATLGVLGNATILQTLFTVLGIVFSISMSLLVSFSLSKILNPAIRSTLRQSITHTRNWLLYDFSLSTLVLIIALVWDTNSLRYSIGSIFTIDIMLLAVCAVAMSLVYEMYNFKKIHTLHSDIEDAIIKEVSC